MAAVEHDALSGPATLLSRHPAPGPAYAVLVAMLVVVQVPDGRASVEQTATPSVQQLTLDVGSPEVKVRRQALRSLRERGGPEALVLLAHLIGDPELDIREGAIEAVIGLYVQPPVKRSMRNAEDAFQLAPHRATPYPVPPELSTALVKALADDYASVRRDSAYATGVVMTPPVSSSVAFELTASLSDREPAVRIAAAQVLGRLRVLSAGVALVGRINDEVLEVRLAAMRAVGDLRDDRAVPALVEQFDFYVRGAAGRAAIDALARIGNDQSRSLFEAQTDSGYPAHRQAAYEGLARVGQLGPAIPRIEAAMSSERDKRVRTAMAFALTASGRPMFEPLFSALTDRDLADRALEYLVELGPPHAADVATLLRDQNPVLREQAAIALGFIGGQEAVAALAAASSDESQEVRSAVSVAQLRLRQRAERRSAGS